MAALPDYDPQETDEWLEALDGVLKQEGVERAHYLLERLIDKARRAGAYLPYSANTAYINTIPPGKEVVVHWELTGSPPKNTNSLDELIEATKGDKQGLFLVLEWKAPVAGK